jgi:hypothetical protein
MSSIYNAFLYFGSQMAGEQRTHTGANSLFAKRRGRGKRPSITANMILEVTTKRPCKDFHSKSSGGFIITRSVYSRVRSRFREVANSVYHTLAFFKTGEVQRHSKGGLFLESCPFFVLLYEQKPHNIITVRLYIALCFLCPVEKLQRDISHTYINDR